jgi:hypothetical protein
MIKGVSLVRLQRVSSASLDWALGGGVDQIWQGANVGVQICAEQGGEIQQVQRPVEALGLSHICIQCADLSAGALVAQAADYRLVSGPTDLGTGYRYLYAHAPDGMLIEMEGAPFAPADMPAFWIGHVAWSCTDASSLAGFYAALVQQPMGHQSRLRGNALFDRVTGLENVDLMGQWVPGLNIGLEFWQFYQPAPAPHWMGAGPSCVVFESDDLPTDVARALSLGAKYEDAATPSKDMARLFDPEGNRFDLVGEDHQISGLAITDLAEATLLQRLDRFHPSRV